MVHKTRTALVVLSIAVGIFAAAVMIGGRGVLIRALDDTFEATVPSAVTFLTTPFDEAFVTSVRRESDVAAAQGRRAVSVSYRGEDGERHNIVLYAIEDYDDISVALLDPPDVGRWPSRGEVFMETGSTDFSGLGRGDLIEIETIGTSATELTVAGTVHDLNASLPIMNGRCVGYISWDTLPDLGEPQIYNQLDVAAAGRLGSLAEASALGSRLRDQVLAPAGVRTLRMTANEPGVQMIADIFRAVALLLVLVGVLTLALSGFLVVNTISALVVQQTRQLGVMRTVGARRGQLAGMYFAMVTAYGLLALAVAIPAGQLGTRRFVEFGARILNYRVPDLSTPGEIVAMELAVGLLVPLLAASVPVALGLRMPVREALYGSGSLGEFGEGWIDRALGKIRGLPRPIALSLRSTFRRKGRLALTLVSLLMAAAVFISVASVRSSIYRTVETVGQHRTMDLWADIFPPQPLERIAELASEVPGVVEAEGWISRASVRVRPDRSESQELFVYGLPPDSRYFHAELVEGRWIRPGDGNAIVIDHGFTESDPDVRVGSTITLRIGEIDLDFRVVGLTRGDLLNHFGWVNRDFLDGALGAGGRVETLMIGTAEHDAESQSEAARDITDSFAEQGVRVTNSITQRTLQGTMRDSLNIIVIFLVIMAALLVAVGGIGLSGTMSINVLESTREIGVMRALGASNRSVYSIFITEGVVVGLISWALGVVASIPLSYLLTAAIGDALGFGLSFAYSFEGVAAWLAFVVIISISASALPAARATRISVAEAISYE